MKRILITGKDSYIGTSVEKWLLQTPDEYKVDTLDVKGDSWREYDFSKYDVVFHVAGIVHQKEKPGMKELYSKVNRDLPVEIAKKAKEGGIKQFIFLSSMSVYGIENGVIDKNTPPNAKSAYGKSKIEAEELINGLQSPSFIVTILRPPMVYGKGCRGNYPKLAKLALRVPFFPNIDNKRSMIYIDNLSEFVRLLIINRHDGLYMPQNKEFVNTTEMVKLIANNHGKRMLVTSLFNPLIDLLKIKLLSKLFGDLVYDLDLSKYEWNYHVCEFDKSIMMTEN